MKNDLSSMAWKHKIEMETITDQVSQAAIAVREKSDLFYGKRYVNFAEHLLSIPWWRRNKELKRLYDVAKQSIKGQSVNGDEL